MEVWMVVFDDVNGDYDVIGIFTSRSKAIESVNHYVDELLEGEFPDRYVRYETYEYAVVLEDNARISAFAFELDVDYS